MSNSIEFKWNIDEFDLLYESCKVDDNVNLSLKYIGNRNARILEVGCGSGRIVKYLKDLGYSNTEGIELNEQIVAEVTKRYPDLKIVSGDLLLANLESDAYDFLISLGVVEHFWNGLDEPLMVHYNILKKDGMALITVPCYNLVRRTSDYIEKIKPYLYPKTNPAIRRLFGKKDIRPFQKTNKFGYNVYPPIGDFFEYRLTPKQFIKECKNIGFEIVESIPISHMDGIYHSFGSDYMQFNNWKFSFTTKGKVLHWFLKRIPFAHNHMHALIVRKP